MLLRHNFSKCGPILKILSLLDSTINLQQDPYYVSHHTLSMSLHYLAQLVLRTRLTFSVRGRVQVCENELNIRQSWN